MHQVITLRVENYDLKKKKSDIFRAIRGYPIFRSPWENMNDKTEDLYKSYKNMYTSSTLW